MSLVPLLPAIDLLDGACVRLYKGDYQKVTRYYDDAMEPCGQYIEAGVQRIHGVDLNAARGDVGEENKQIIAKMARKLPGGIQVGGGIRTLETVKKWHDLGVWRVIVGTVAMNEPEKVIDWAKQFPDFVVAGLDAMDGVLRSSGWLHDAGNLSDAAQIYKQSQIAAILYTCIDRDGTLGGPDIDGTFRLANESGKPVIVSGGVASMVDLHTVNDRLKSETKAQIDGVITGKAVFEGRITMDEIQAYCQGNRC